MMLAFIGNIPNHISNPPGCAGLMRCVGGVVKFKLLKFLKVASLLADASDFTSGILPHKCMRCLVRYSQFDNTSVF
jgi:hypothetical protein